MAVESSEKSETKWTYTTYRFILWAYMMNDIAVVFTPVDMSHTGFYIYSVLYILFAIFIGIPLVYSELCIAQYTNHSIVSMWNFCPILRGVGHGTVYLIVLKTVYMMVLSTWYLEYSFHSALDPPPWFSCDDYGDQKCMVKKVNVSTFQHCIEAQKLFNEDCGMKTASRCFFDREIGNNNTKNKNCLFIWKTFLCGFLSSSGLFIFLMKKKRFFKIFVRMLACYMSSILLILFVVALSTSGTWYATKIGIHIEEFDDNYCFYILSQSVLTFGTGCGMIGFLSKNMPFRSPAPMTAVTTPLLSIFISLVYGIIIFSGIKTVSYYHGEEENVVEVGNTILFNPFASTAEILSYFDNLPVWGFCWFSTVFVCLFINMFIHCLCLLELLTSNYKTAHKYNNLSCFILSFLIGIISWPFYCSDLAVVLTDVTQIIQLTSNLFFSLGIYWIYGFQKHNVDIIFMIGVKASYFWKFSWITSPIWIIFIIYTKLNHLQINSSESSYYISSLFIHVDQLLIFVLCGIYIFIIIIGTCNELRRFYKYDTVWNICRPYKNWGPQDKILFRSRNMFVPEIMTREFLYRQVRIHGYIKNYNKFKQKVNVQAVQEPTETLDWSALTSN